MQWTLTFGGFIGYMISHQVLWDVVEHSIDGRSLGFPSQNFHLVTLNPSFGQIVKVILSYWIIHGSNTLALFFHLMFNETLISFRSLGFGHCKAGRVLLYGGWYFICLGAWSALNFVLHEVTIALSAFACGKYSSIYDRLICHMTLIYYVTCHWMTSAFHVWDTYCQLPYLA